MHAGLGMNLERWEFLFHVLFNGLSNIFADNDIRILRHHCVLIEMIIPVVTMARYEFKLVV